MKKTISVIITAVLAMTFIFSACGGGGGEEGGIYKIGISQYGEHASLDNCRTGFIQGIEEAGLKEGTDFEIIYQNAGFDDNVTLQIAQSFASQDVDMMCGIATNSAVACFAEAEDNDIPVVFTAISDPVQAKLDNGNITGVSDKLPVTAQLELIRKLQPDAKTIGIIYTTSEPNSVSTIKDYEENAAAYGFTIDAVGITSQAEVTQAADTLIGRNVDCFSNLTDNTVVGVLPAILEKTNEAGIPVYGSEIEQGKIGCVASAGIDYVKLGVQAGQLAARVVKGEAASDIPYETVSQFEIYINSAAAEDNAVTIPDDVKAAAIETSQQ